jgi:DNA invertase Pin-like site-specific DNA recombinase
MTSDLVKLHHLDRKAVIYVRQSTPHQVMTNQESLRLQYALRDRAMELGWHDTSIEIIDADLGYSGSTTSHREGFKDVIGRVTLGEIGIILSYEVTRLARNCSDWYPLLDLRGFRQCLIGDRDGIYDPGSANGRLLLGLKGTISEVELHTLRGRLTAGLLNKAERGELALLLPAGLERLSHGIVTKDPSLEVQDRIGPIFSRFLQLGSVMKTVRSFRNHGLLVPRRARFGDIAWREPTANNLFGVLKNPGYAGAFVYGRTRSCQATYASGKVITARRPMAEWKVVVKDRYPAYLDWESFERVQAMLRDNHAHYLRTTATRGAPRNGAAVLQGIVWCGECGHKMCVEYKNGNRYICNFLQRSQGGTVCQHLPADLVDAKVTQAFFAAVGPAELRAWTDASEERRRAGDALDRAEAQQLERLRYEALLAERRYNRVDPDNRLIAAEPERRWEQALRSLKHAEEDLARHRATRENPETMSLDEQSDFISVGSDLPDLWHREQISRDRKKAMLRSLIDKVVAHRETRDGIKIRIIWRGGEVSNLAAAISVHALSALTRGAEMEARLVELARLGIEDAEIAERLNKEGYRSARRLYAPLRTVQIVRQRHRILRQKTPVREKSTPGWLSITEMAHRLNVSRYWINRHIRNSKIEMRRDQSAKRFLFPDTSESIEQIQALKSGQRTTAQIPSRII